MGSGAVTATGCPLCSPQQGTWEEEYGTWQGAEGIESRDRKQSGVMVRVLRGHREKS